MLHASRVHIRRALTPNHARLKATATRRAPKSSERAVETAAKRVIAAIEDAKAVLAKELKKRRTSLAPELLSSSCVPALRARSLIRSMSRAWEGLEESWQFPGKQLVAKIGTSERLEMLRTVPDDALYAMICGVRFGDPSGRGQFKLARAPPLEGKASHELPGEREAELGVTRALLDQLVIIGVEHDDPEFERFGECWGGIKETRVRELSFRFAGAADDDVHTATITRVDQCEWEYFYSIDDVIRGCSSECNEASVVFTSRKGPKSELDEDARSRHTDMESERAALMMTWTSTILERARIVSHPIVHPLRTKQILTLILFCILDGPYQERDDSEWRECLDWLSYLAKDAVDDESLRLEVEAGNPRAAARLAAVLAQDATAKSPVDHDLLVQTCRTAIPLGIPLAMHLLATHLLEHGTRAEDREEAASLLQRAVALEHRPSLLALAKCYANGLGVEQDWAAARALYVRDAECTLEQVTANAIGSRSGLKSIMALVDASSGSDGGPEDVAVVAALAKAASKLR